MAIVSTESPKIQDSAALVDRVVGVLFDMKEVPDLDAAEAKKKAEYVVGTITQNELHAYTTTRDMLLAGRYRRQQEAEATIRPGLVRLPAPEAERPMNEPTTDTETTTTELVPFQGGHIEAQRRGDRALVVIKSVCEHLDIDVENQRKKLNQAAWATTVMITAVAKDGKNREVACLDLDCLPMWLATIQTTKVKPSARPLLEAYQREAARVLRDHFFGRREEAAPRHIGTDPMVLQMLERLTVAVESLARTVQSLDERVTALENRAATASPRALAGHDSRRAALRIRELVREVATLEAAYHLRGGGDADVFKKLVRERSSHLQTWLRDVVKYPGAKGRSWQKAPAAVQVEAVMHLSERHADVKRLHDRVRGPRQMTLDDVEAVRKRKPN
jgi:hypothetical protein